jgi:hypothetical protein
MASPWPARAGNVIGRRRLDPSSWSRGDRGLLARTTCRPAPSERDSAFSTCWIASRAICAWAEAFTRDAPRYSGEWNFGPDEHERRTAAASSRRWPPRGRSIDLGARTTAALLRTAPVGLLDRLFVYPAYLGERGESLSEEEVTRLGRSLVSRLSPGIGPEKLVFRSDFSPCRRDRGIMGCDSSKRTSPARG